MSSLEYWEESLASSLDEHGVTATPEQLKAIASDIQISHENIGLAFHVPENPLIGEVKELKIKLEKERSKIVCRKCNGHGRITSDGPYHSSNSECYYCRGEGYL